MFRDLKPDEIDVRVQSIKEDYKTKEAKGAVLLLYKDARADMIILDETVGAWNWERIHTRDNKNCIVRLWDDTKEQWISKEDTGTESMTEKEKGLASDSFKRACVNWGIGRELYTSPFIWVDNEGDMKYKEVNGKRKYYTYTKFYVSDIKVVDKKIVSLTIKDEKNRVRYTTGEKAKNPVNNQLKIGKDKIETIKDKIKKNDIDEKAFNSWLKTKFKVNKIEDILVKDYKKVFKAVNKEDKK